MAIITKTLKASGGDYQTLAAWASAEATDLVAAGDSHELLCDGFLLTQVSSWDLSAWNTGPSNTITIKAAPGHEHGGVSRDDGGTGFKVTTSGEFTADITAPYTTVQDIEIECTSTTGSAIRTGGNVLLDRLIVKTPDNGSDTYKSIVSGSNDTIRNCLVMSGRRGLDFRSVSGAIAQNCTVIVVDAVDYGILTDNQNEVVNCVSYGFTTKDFLGLTAVDGYNASEDTSASGGTNDVTGVVEADFEDFAADDFVPAEGGALAGTALNLSGVFSEDIAGNPRTSWDIGAYAIAGGAQAPLTLSAEKGSFDFSGGRADFIVSGPPQTAPTLTTPIPDQTNDIGEAVSLDIRNNFDHATGYFTTTAPAGIELSEGGVFSGAALSGGVVSVTVTAYNNIGSVDDTFQWTIEGAAQIPPTLLDPIPYQTDNINDAINFDISGNFSGADSYSADVEPPGVTLSAAGVFTGAGTVEGVTDITVTATNAYGSVQAQPFRWTMNDPYAPQPVRRKYEYIMDEGSGDVITNSDPDTGAAFNGSWSNDTGWTNFPANSRLYPINEGSGSDIANVLDPSGATDGIIENYTNNWTEE